MDKNKLNDLMLAIATTLSLFLITFSVYLSAFSPDGVFLQILYFFLAIAIPVGFLVTYIIFRKRYPRALLHGIGSACTIILLLAIGVPLSLIVNKYYMPAYIILLCLLTACTLQSAFTSKRVRNVFTVIILCLVFSGSLSLAGGIVYHEWQDKISIVNIENINVHNYLAFDRNADIARLPKEASLRLSGSNLPVINGAAAMFPMYSSFVEATYPAYAVGGLNHRNSPYRYTNTVAGYEELVYGETDIMIGVSPSAAQIAFAEEQGKQIEVIEIGREAFVFFVNSKNSIKSLSQAQLREIYAGKVTNWREVGGDNLNVQPFQRNPGSGSQTALESFMGDIPLMTPPTELVHGLMIGIIERVSDYKNYRGAIGFSFLYYASALVGNPDIHILSVEGVAPSAQTIADGSYPITRPVVLAVTHRTPEINAFIDWVLSPEGQYLVKNSGYTPIRNAELS